MTAEQDNIQIRHGNSISASASWRTNEEEPDKMHASHVDLTKELQPHSLEQYCELCRRFSNQHRYKATYLGYALLPDYPLGVCQ